MMTSQRQKIFAANWKMNMSAEEAESFIQEFLQADRPADAKILIFPPALYLSLLTQLTRDSMVTIGAQNIYWERYGAFTGEISAPMVRGSGAGYVICGHSERRHIFNESSEMVTRKARAAQAEGLIPVICIGETLKEREAGETQEVLQSDTLSSLAAVAPVKNIIIAYEPVWAIGTGLTASPADAQAAISFIRKQIRELWGDIADDIHILYGGSVKPSNIRELMACPDIDGALIGGASLEVESFLEIIRNGIR